MVEPRTIEDSNLASLTQQQKEEQTAHVSSSSSVRKSSALAMESATSASAVATSLSSKTAALVAEASSSSSTSVQQQSSKFSQHKESAAVSSIAASTSATANIRKTSSQSKVSASEMSAQKSVEFQQDLRRRSLSTERRRVSSAESTAIKSTTSQVKTMAEESRMSSAKMHQGVVSSLQIEKGLASGNAMVAQQASIDQLDSSAMVSAAETKFSSAAAQRKSSFTLSSEEHSRSVFYKKLSNILIFK